MSILLLKPSHKLPLAAARGWLCLICLGLCMGTADIIPGISGGTIAFIMGFYEDFLYSLKTLNRSAFKTLLKGHFRKFFNLIAWKFLLGLLIGIILAMLCLAHLVSYLLNHETYRSLLYATFFGLIIAATLLCMGQVKHWTLLSIFLFASSASLAFFLTQSSSMISSSNADDLYDIKIDNIVSDKPLRNYDFSTHTLKAVPASMLSAMLAKEAIPPTTLAYSYKLANWGPVEFFLPNSKSKSLDPWIIFCGALAVCAMILPGISGSYLLSILGMYTIAVGALADFSSSLKNGHFDHPSFLILANLLLGIFLGALFFSRFISWILDKHHDLAIASLTGFMIGAIKAVWPFWSYQYALLPLHLEKGAQLETLEPILPSWTSYETWLALGLTVCGALLVFGLHIAAKSLQKRPA
ncbi:DUF368 domain-containing protein [Neochlamydia sp. S13]|uniref:DUF368 domain-containing protein n=1 Tax=Neochlamydia sp. S13 TaxID=1353976 RepID=UPI000693AFBC|nr:DUF368 domain-containing protein [Neochlamydia sp. S13]